MHLDVVKPIYNERLAHIFIDVTPSLTKPVTRAVFQPRCAGGDIRVLGIQRAKQ